MHTCTRESKSEERNWAKKTSVFSIPHCPYVSCLGLSESSIMAQTSTLVVAMSSFMARKRLYRFTPQSFICEGKGSSAVLAIFTKVSHNYFFIFQLQMLAKIKVTKDKGENVSSVPGPWTIRPTGSVDKNYDQWFPHKESMLQNDNEKLCFWLQ